MHTHAGIENERLRIKIVDEQQTYDAQNQRPYGKCVQKLGADAIGDPQQDRCFYEPAYGNPMRVKPDWNSNGDKADRQSQVKEVQSLAGCRIFLSRPHLPAQEDVNGCERQGEPGAGRLVDLLEHDIDLQEVNTSIHKRYEVRNRGEEPGYGLHLRARNQGSDSKDCEKEGGEPECQTQFAAVIKTYVPADVKRERAKEAEHQQAPPRLEGNQDQGGQV